MKDEWLNIVSFSLLLKFKLGRLAILVGLGLAFGDTQDKTDDATNTAQQIQPQDVAALAHIVLAAHHSRELWNENYNTHDEHQDAQDDDCGGGVL